ncbi:hypothetical protein RFI_31651, partial [Reticulomyxa filosa]
KKRIRTRMREVIRNHVSSEDLKGVIRKLSQSSIGREIKKSCQLIFPLKTCLVEKVEKKRQLSPLYWRTLFKIKYEKNQQVKVMRGPKRDVARLLKIHELSAAFDPLSESDLLGPETAVAAEEPKEEAAKDADGDLAVAEA